MARVFLHCPLNITRSLTEMLEDFAKHLREKNRTAIYFIESLS